MIDGREREERMPKGPWNGLAVGILPIAPIFLVEKCKSINRTTQLMPYNNEELSFFQSKM